VEQVHDFFTVACVGEGATPLVAGDFNASIGTAFGQDEIKFLGFCGCGQRKAKGWSLVNSVLGNGLLIQNRMDTAINIDASWTCNRSFDGALVQLDFVVNFSHMTLVPQNIALKAPAYSQFVSPQNDSVRNTRLVDKFGSLESF